MIIKKRRDVDEINSSSMADIAFLMMMTKLLLPWSMVTGITYIIKTMSFIIILSIFCSILMSFLSHFRILFRYSFVHRFLMFFWSKSDAQNRPKMTPKSTPVRPRATSGFLASSGHLWTCYFYDFWCQNGSQNDLKMTPVVLINFRGTQE